MRKRLKRQESVLIIILNYFSLRFVYYSSTHSSRILSVVSDNCRIREVIASWVSQNGVKVFLSGFTSRFYTLRPLSLIMCHHYLLLLIEFQHNTQLFSTARSRGFILDSAVSFVQFGRFIVFFFINKKFTKRGNKISCIKK